MRKSAKCCRGVGILAEGCFQVRGWTFRQGAISREGCTHREVRRNSIRRSRDPCIIQQCGRRPDEAGTSAVREGNDAADSEFSSVGTFQSVGHRQDEDMIVGRGLADLALAAENHHAVEAGAVERGVVSAKWRGS